MYVLLKKELWTREGYYIKILDSANKIIPGRTNREYRNNNKDKMQDYRDNNNYKMTKYNKEYYISNRK